MLIYKDRLLKSEGEKVKLSLKVQWEISVSHIFSQSYCKGGILEDEKEEGDANT